MGNCLRPLPNHRTRQGGTEMSKFKVGDRVVLTKDFYDVPDRYIGKTGIVIEDSFNPLTIDFGDGNHWAVFETEIKLDPKQPLSDQILSFINANPMLSKDALIEGIKSIINASL